MSNRGHFIVIEGLEGAGKSTALKTIIDFLTGTVPDIITTREPGGTHVGEAVRKLIKNPIPDEPLDPRSELLLFYAARVQLMKNVILPALSKGTWVLADRFELSTFAYQGGGRKLDQEMIHQLSSFSLEGFKPDLIIFLDVSPETGLQRAKSRGQLDRMEQEPLKFFTDIYESYHQHIKSMDNVASIDANQSLDTVQDIIRSTLENYLINHVTSFN